MPTGLIRASAASARPPAICTAQAYLLVPVLDTHIEPEVSTSRYTGICLGASYSLMNGRPIRAVTRQSICFTGSPASYGRLCAYSMPEPTNGEASVPY